MIAEVAVPGYWETLEENADTWAQEISVQPFWARAKRASAEWSGEYYAKVGDALLRAEGLPNFSGKRLPRLKEKTLAEYRADPAKVFPDVSKPVPQLKDLVRVRIETRFLDGIEFLAAKLRRLFSEQRMPTEEKLQAKETGYYALHMYFADDRVFKRSTSTHVTIICEIQIATELSTTIWDRTHRTYESARVADDKDMSWRWNPDDPRFLAAQLGNIHVNELAIERVCTPTITVTASMTVEETIRVCALVLNRLSRSSSV